MELTTKQALSFVDAISKGAPKHFFDARLGVGQTPKVDDFTTDDSERLDKAEEFLDCVQSVTDTLVEALRNQPRQTSLLAGFDSKVKGTETFNPTADDGKPIHDKPAKKKPRTQKTPAKKTPAKKGKSK